MTVGCVAGDEDSYEELLEEGVEAATAKFTIDTQRVKANVKRDSSKNFKGSKVKSNQTKKRNKYGKIDRSTRVDLL